MVVDTVAPRVLAADERITAVYPRFQTEVEFTVDGNIGRGTLLALDPATTPSALLTW